MLNWIVWSSTDYFYKNGFFIKQPSKVDTPSNPNQLTNTILNWIVLNRTGYTYKTGFVFNNLQWLMYHKAKQNRIKIVRNTFIFCCILLVRRCLVNRYTGSCLISATSFKVAKVTFGGRFEYNGKRIAFFRLRA